MKKIALYGGTFDPFHLGHRAVCKGLLELDHFDQLIVMTSGDSPHKSMQNRPPAVYRYKMAQLSLRDLLAQYPDTLELSDFEILQAGTSYTLKTLQALKDSCPCSCELSLIGGSDVLHEILSWYEPLKILELAHLGIIHRPGYRAAQDKLAAAKLEQRYGATVHFYPLSVPKASSSSIRSSIAAGLDPASQAIAEDVAAFISSHRIYQDGPVHHASSEQQAKWLELWRTDGFDVAFEAAEKALYNEDE